MEKFIVEPDWVEIYKGFNREFKEEIFGGDEGELEDEQPFMSLLYEFKDDPETFEGIVDYFYSRCLFICLDEYGSIIKGKVPPYITWLKAIKDYRSLILSLAKYFKK